MPSFIAREGYGIILIILIIDLSLLVFSFFVGIQFAVGLRIVAIAIFLLLIFTISFFRDPERKIVYTSKSLIAPADGTIIAIKKVNEPQYIKNTTNRISIFMSIFDVHVNRSPTNGTIEFLKYNSGKFISAFKDKASEENESLFIGIKIADHDEKIAVNFIAGLIARRIVFYRKLHDPIGQGERINIIKFGSRVDLYCSDNFEIKVKRGDKVRASQTVLAISKD